MGADKWNKVIKFLNTTKADPEKVLKSLKVIYGKTSNKNSWYQIWRGSWPIEVVVAIYNKEGTPNTVKKRSLTEIVKNWVKSDVYQVRYDTFHPGPGNMLHEFDDNYGLNLWDPIPTDSYGKTQTSKTFKRHVRNCMDHWNNKKGRALRKILDENNGMIPVKNMNKFSLYPSTHIKGKIKGRTFPKTSSKILKEELNKK
jgi:hypothetical protein|tara:strand:- start:67 stop:663 length:597 start_codon:yes stop_codon:yes gene_type:complete